MKPSMTFLVRAARVLLGIWWRGRRGCGVQHHGFCARCPHCGLHGAPTWALNRCFYATPVKDFPFVVKPKGTP